MVVGINKGYIAFVLDEVSQEGLIRLFHPNYQRKVCHHVTLKYDCFEVEFQDYLEKFKNAKVTTVNYLWSFDDKADCVTVNLTTAAGEVLTHKENGERYHITLSLGENVKPSITNSFANKSPSELNSDFYFYPRPNELYPFKLTGEIKFIPFHKLQ